MAQTLQERREVTALSSWSSTRPDMGNANAFIRAFTRFNVYLYSKPPSPMLKRINKGFLHFNIFMFRVSRGRIFGHFGKLQAMLLTTTGRKTGKARTNPVGYIYDRGRFIVCATPGHFDVPGGPQASQPAWYHNVRANPKVTVDIGVEQFQATAEILTGEARDREWRRITDVMPFIAEFQKRASHPIPVIVLTPDDLDPQTL